MTDPILDVRALEKSFTLHNQGGARIQVFTGLDLVVNPGECVVLAGPSGAGKSTLMRAIYGNYLVSGGSITIRHNGASVDLAQAEPGLLRQIRRQTMGYVSQFLRVIPRVPTVELVMDPLMVRGMTKAESRVLAETLLTRLNLPQSHWMLPPATFSGGEQQRVNIARGFAPFYPLLLLDEPTASLDPHNTQIAIELIRERLSQGAAVIGIFHDQAVRDALGARAFDVTHFQIDASPDPMK